MQVLIKLFATLREGRFKQQVSELASGTPVSAVLTDLGIPPEDIAILLVNGRDATVDRILQDGDTVALFPPVGGG